MTKQDCGTLVLATALTGIAVGLALATRELSRFSPVPENFLLGLVFLAGIALGGLLRGFAQLLAAILVVMLVGGAVMTAALLVAELGDSLLGLEVTLSVAVGKAVLNGFLFIFPLTLIGALIGRLFQRD
ncbi:MAG: hypothetical protein K6T71_06640 [Candidatus Bipolaricaulota bacterium]|nr:hypothetical protein [Candidatus Bipolaricaulota bacterium]